MKHGTASRFALAVASLAVMLAVAEAACRLRFAWDVELIRHPDHRLAKDGPETNADGIRSEHEAGDFHDGDVNLIVLGDSFVYGFREHPEFAFPQQLERIAREARPDTRVNVANFGWVSSSPVLSLRLLKDLGPAYKPDAVFLCVDMTDFHDDIKYRHLIERDRLVYKGLAVFPGLVTLAKKVTEKLGLARLHDRLFDLPLDRFFIVNRPLAETRARLAPTLDAIRDTEAFTRNTLHARFILVILPRPFQYSRREVPENWEKSEYTVMGPYAREPFVLFREFATGAGYPVCSLLETFESCGVFPTCLYDDPHWRREGHAVAARALYDIAVAQGLLPSAPSGTGRR